MLRLKPARFHVGGHKGGTRIRFRLSRPARVTLTFERRRTDRRKHVRFKRVGSRTVGKAHRGGNKVKFSGRLRHRRLAAGRYRLTAKPRGGVAHRKSFTVVAVRKPHGRR